MTDQSKWDENKQTGFYRRPVHHGEMMGQSKMTDAGTSTLDQNLAAEAGINLAKKLLNSRNKKLKNDS